VTQRIREGGQTRPIEVVTYADGTWILATTAISSLPQLAPSDQAGSYSTLSIRRPAHGPDLISTSLLAGNRTGVTGRVVHQHMLFDVLAASRLGMLAEGSHLTVMRRQAPIVLVMFISNLVPYTDRPPFFGLVTLAGSMIAASARLCAARNPPDRPAAVSCGPT